jgi:hypothetical protein
MRWSMLLGVLVIAVAAFLALTWSQRASVRVQQQILEMRIKAFRNQKAQHSPSSESELQSQGRLEDGQQEPDSPKAQGDHTR